MWYVIAEKPQFFHRCVHPRCTTNIRYATYKLTKRIPCDRNTVFLRLTTMARIINVLDAMTMMRSVLLTTSKGNSTTLEVMPRTHSKLNIFEPTTLPTAISVWLRYAATAEATNSGGRCAYCNDRKTNDSIIDLPTQCQTDSTIDYPLTTEIQSHGAQ